MIAGRAGKCAIRRTKSGLIRLDLSSLSLSARSSAAAATGVCLGAGSGLDQQANCMRSDLAFAISRLICPRPNSGGQTSCALSMLAQSKWAIRPMTATTALRHKLICQILPPGQRRRRQWRAALAERRTQAEAESDASAQPHASAQRAHWLPARRSSQTINCAPLSVFFVSSSSASLASTRTHIIDSNQSSAGLTLMARI